MKFTSEDLMKAMGLVVGDRIKYGVVYGVISRDEDNEIIIEIYTQKDEYCGDAPLYELMGCEYRILPRPKRVGDLKCEGDNCDKCPLYAVCSMYASYEGLSLYECFERNKTLAPDQEIYNLLKARLDKEVVEE